MQFKISRGIALGSLDARTVSFPLITLILLIYLPSSAPSVRFEGEVRRYRLWSVLLSCRARGLTDRCSSRPAALSARLPAALVPT